MVTIICTRSTGSGTRGKRYLRISFHLKLGRDIYEGRTTVMGRRSETGKEPGDPEPPYLYKSQAFYDAVKEYTDTQVLNKNPIISLAIKCKMNHLSKYYSRCRHRFIFYYILLEIST